MFLRSLSFSKGSIAWGSLRYLAQETWIGLVRGGWLNGAAILAVTVALFFFGLGLHVSQRLDTSLQQLGSRLEVTAYLKPDANLENVQQQVAQIANIADVTVIHREQAWTELLTDLGIDPSDEPLPGVQANPLVDELKLRATTSATVPDVAQAIAQIPAVDSVHYLDRALASMQRLSRSLQLFGLGIVSLLALTAIAMIATILRLLVIVRHPEIEIMELVGATPRWIRLPFILQGIILGASGGILAWGMIRTLEQSVLGWLQYQQQLPQLLLGILGEQSLAGVGILIGLTGVGMMVGLMGSSLSLITSGKKS